MDSEWKERADSARLLPVRVQLHGVAVDVPLVAQGVVEPLNERRFDGRQHLSRPLRGGVVLAHRVPLPQRALAGMGQHTPGVKKSSRKTADGWRPPPEKQIRCGVINHLRRGLIQFGKEGRRRGVRSAEQVASELMHVPVPCTMFFFLSFFYISEKVVLYVPCIYLS